jgi:hypothetical protein
MKMLLEDKDFWNVVSKTEVRRERDIVNWEKINKKKLGPSLSRGCMILCFKMSLAIKQLKKPGIIY